MRGRYCVTFEYEYKEDNKLKRLWFDGNWKSFEDAEQEREWFEQHGYNEGRIIGVPRIMRQYPDLG